VQSKKLLKKNNKIESVKKFFRVLYSHLYKAGIRNNQSCIIVTGNVQYSARYIENFIRQKNISGKFVAIKWGKLLA